MLCNGVYIHHLWGSYWIVWSCIANNSTRLQTSVSVIRKVRTGLCKLFSSSWESTQAFLTCSDTFRHHCWNSKELFVTQNRNCTVWFPVFFPLLCFIALCSCLHCVLIFMNIRVHFIIRLRRTFHSIKNTCTKFFSLLYSSVSGHKSRFTFFLCFIFFIYIYIYNVFVKNKLAIHVTVVYGCGCLWLHWDISCHFFVLILNKW